MFYYLYWENDTKVHDVLYTGENPLGIELFKNESKTPYLLTAFKTRRLSRPHKQGTRSKYIVRPEEALELGNHVLYLTVGKYKYFDFAKIQCIYQQRIFFTMLIKHVMNIIPFIINYDHSFFRVFF